MLPHGWVGGCRQTPTMATAAARIAVLEGGRVVELGAHDELVGRAGGAYRRLLGAQEALPPLADFEDEISEADILQV